ncbi:MAG: hypothetical protein KA232_11180 [Chryseobacterium sp.]|nr:hypothetical protein [Chryseobacterium sp.]
MGNLSAFRSLPILHRDPFKSGCGFPIQTKEVYHNNAYHSIGNPKKSLEKASSS